MFLFVKNNFSVRFFSCVGARYVTSAENTETKNIDAIKFIGHGMSDSLPYSEIIFNKTVSLEKTFITKFNSETGYALEVNLKDTAFAEEEPMI